MPQPKEVNELMQRALKEGDVVDVVADETLRLVALCMALSVRAMLSGAPQSGLEILTKITNVASRAVCEKFDDRFENKSLTEIMSIMKKETENEA